MTSRDVT